MGGEFIRFGLVAALVGLTGGSLTSCKGSSDDEPTAESGGDGDGDETTPTEWPDETEEVRTALSPLLEEVCRWQFDCCTAGQREFTISGTSEDLDDCVERLYEVSRTGSHFNEPGPLSWLPRFFVYLGYDLDLDRVTIDEDALEICLEKLGERECNAPPQAGDHCMPTVPVEIPECETRALLKGSQTLGQPCAAVAGGVECAEGLTCSSLGAEGVCIEFEADGAPCVEDYQCGDGFICDYRSNTCAQGGGEGDECSFFDPDYPELGTERKRCASGFLCDPRTDTCEPANCAYGTSCNDSTACPEDLDCIMNRCQEPLKLNQYCYDDEHCESGRCDNYNNICIPFSPNGSPCDEYTDCESGYCDGENCRARRDTGEACGIHEECNGYCDYTLGECADLLSSGDSCTDNAECGDFEELAFIDAVCRNLPRNDGQTCYDSYQCASELCGDDGTCEARGTEGAPCSLDQWNVCGEGLFCEVEDGEVDGECVPQLGPGEECFFDAQCPSWDCRVVGGRKRCGQQSSASEAMCDGLDD